MSMQALLESPRAASEISEWRDVCAIDDVLPGTGRCGADRRPADRDRSHAGRTVRRVVELRSIQQGLRDRARDRRRSFGHTQDRVPRSTSRASVCRRASAWTIRACAWRCSRSASWPVGFKFRWRRKTRHECAHGCSCALGRLAALAAPCLPPRVRSKRTARTARFSAG